MANNKNTIPKRLIGMVCKYYGIGDVKELATSAKLSLSSCCRRSIHEEACQVACWMLQRHCNLSAEELQAALKQLQWNSIKIRLCVEQAKRKLESGDFSFRLSVLGIEQLLLLELGGCQRCSNSSAKRSRNGVLNWHRASLTMETNKGEQYEKG